jgi:hypothetical protein
VLTLPMAGIKMKVSLLLNADLCLDVHVARFKKVLDNLRVPVEHLAIKTQDYADAASRPDYAVSVQRLLRALPALR